MARTVGRYGSDRPRSGHLTVASGGERGRARHDPGVPARRPRGGPSWPARPAAARGRHRGGRRVRPGRRRPAASPRCGPTWRSSTPGCPTATASTCAGTSARSTPSIKGLILTSYEDDEALFAAIMAGAAGYVLKQIRGTDLVDAVRRVAAGQSLLDPAVTQRVLERIRSGVGAAARAEDPDRAGAADPGVRRRGADQPGDRRQDVPGREDREELRLQPAGQARPGTAYPGGGARHPAARHSATDPARRPPSRRR